MAYQSLYRRFRPRRFAELRGQDHVVRALRNAVRDDRVGHAYLFSGPRGTGKTSAARILAKVLNCERPVDGEPCGECASCLAVEAGTSFDVHELDAASNNGVDAMRDLIERTMLATPGRNRVYILDEVHMLSRAAEAALLKTLEEPPSHVVFVLATTDPQKVSETIRSRTQHLEFHLLPAEVLESLVRDIATTDRLDVSGEAVEAVVRQGAGSARDTLSALDQVVTAGGVVEEHEPLDEITEALIEADTGRALAAVATAVSAGRDARTLTERLVAHLRDGFLSLMNPDLVQLPDRAATRVADQATRMGAAATVRAMEVLGETLVDLRHAPDPRLLLDVALVRLTNRDADTSPAALLARIERLERAGQRDASGPSGAGSERSGRAALGSRARREDPPPSPAAAPAAPEASPAATIPAPVPAPAPAALDPAAPFPSRDALTIAWADHVVPRLKGMARALYLPGRFVAADASGATFALPNGPQLTKCEQYRSEVEAALAEYFHRPVPLRLVLDDAEAPARSGPSVDGPPDDEVDVAELVDAPPGRVRSGLDRVTEAFPGAQLVEE
jgi:DNA polymerase III subunit gamma/tau